MKAPDIVSCDKWLRPRSALLAKEQEMTRSTLSAAACLWPESESVARSMGLKLLSRDAICLRNAACIRDSHSEIRSTLSVCWIERGARSRPQLSLNTIGA